MEGLGVIGDNAADGRLNPIQNIDDFRIAVIVATADVGLDMHVRFSVEFAPDAEVRNWIPVRGAQHPGRLLSWQKAA